MSVVMLITLALAVVYDNSKLRRLLTNAAPPIDPTTLPRSLDASTRPHKRENLSHRQALRLLNQLPYSDGSARSAHARNRAPAVRTGRSPRTRAARIPVTPTLFGHQLREDGTVLFDCTNHIAGQSLAACRIRCSKSDAVVHREPRVTSSNAVRISQNVLRIVLRRGEHLSVFDNL